MRTVRGFGYAFCAAVASPAVAEPPPTAVCRLVAWGIEQRWLAAGEYLMGRDDEGDEIRLGSVVFSLHWLAVAGPTETLASAGLAGPDD